jgi:hypothetical protein
LQIQTKDKEKGYNKLETKSREKIIHFLHLKKLKIVFEGLRIMPIITGKNNPLSLERPKF